MAKLATGFELALPPNTSTVPAYRWLYTSLRAEILHGRLRPGTRLPSSRDLARQYGLARGTIVNAFEQLKSEGYLEGSVGSGTYVSRILPEQLLQAFPHSDANHVEPFNRRLVVSDYGRRASLFSGYEDRPPRAFRANLPALDMFPTALWAQITNRCLHRLSRSQLMGCEPLGYLPLREALAEYLSRSRGVKCTAQQVLILSGVQEALDLVARLFLNPGDRVCMEEPGYLGALLTFKAFGAKISFAGLDGEGIRIGDLPTRGVRFSYVTPGHQFPLGTTMTLPRRLQLLEWARKSGALIFEDDYDSEYRYSGRPIPALQGLDGNGLVLYAGTLSKVLFPSLRLGYLVFPSDLLHYIQAIKSLATRHAPLLEQVVLSNFMTEGHFARHLRRMRELYAERLAFLLEEARRRLAGLLELSSVEAGLQTVGWLCRGIDSESAAAAAARRNVDVTPLSRYSHANAAPEGLQLGFAAVDTKEIRLGVRELAIALEGELKSAK